MRLHRIGKTRKRRMRKETEGHFVLQAVLQWFIVRTQGFQLKDMITSASWSFVFMCFTVAPKSISLHFIDPHLKLPFGLHIHCHIKLMKQFFKLVHDGAAQQPRVHSEAVSNYVCATVLWLFKYFLTFHSYSFRKISGAQKIKGKCD